MTTHTVEEKKIEGKNFSVFHAGKFHDLLNYELMHPRLNKKMRGKFLAKEELGLTGMQVSLNQLPPGKGTLFSHQHKQNEELYVFISGKGQMQIDAEIIDVCEGSCVRIATDGLRAWRNNGTEDLVCICIQAKENSLDQHTFEDGIPKMEAPVWE